MQSVSNFGAAAGVESQQRKSTARTQASSRVRPWTLENITLAKYRYLQNARISKIRKLNFEITLGFVGKRSEVP